MPASRGRLLRVASAESGERYGVAGRGSRGGVPVRAGMGSTGSPTVAVPAGSRLPKAIASSSRPTWPALCGRSTGSFCSRWSTSAESCAGTAGSTACTGRGEWWMTRLSVARSLSASNGEAPVNIS